MGVTPEKARGELRRLAEEAAAAQAAAEAHAARVQRLEAVLAFEVSWDGAEKGACCARPGWHLMSLGNKGSPGADTCSLSSLSAVLPPLPTARPRNLPQAQQRGELSEFCALEHQVLTEQEGSLAEAAAQLRADAAAAAQQLADARQRLVDTDAALLQRDEEVGPHDCCCRCCRVRAGAAGVLSCGTQRVTEVLHRPLRCS